MLGELRKLFSLLTKTQRIRLLRLQFLVLLMVFAEVVGVISIGPFMALVGDINQLQGQGALADIYRESGIKEPRHFLVAVGVFVLLMLGMATSISIWTTWRFAMYGHQVGADLSVRLFEHYMYQPWLYHANSSSSELTNRVMQECARVTQNIVLPFLKMNAKLFLALSMAATIFWFDPFVALLGFLMFVFAYFALYRIVRLKLIANGLKVTDDQRTRFGLLNNGLGGIRDVLLLGRQQIFVSDFERASNRLAKSLGSNAVLAQVPGYAMELVAFGSVILLVIYLLITHQGDLGTMLPLLSVYALAGFKMLPAFQQVYSGVANIRSNLAAFNTIEDDLEATVGNLQVSNSRFNKSQVVDNISPTVSAGLDSVKFTYPGKPTPALRGITLDIPAKGVVGIVGASGSGKSTSIDILLGLIDPDSGAVLVDGVAVGSESLHLWQGNIGFVPQKVFLAEASIRENIAFGLPSSEIDNRRIDRAIAFSHLTDTIEQLPKGIDTFVGERGVQLSGGQQQRIGIARALYHEPDVLVLDEATSALDGISEKAIMDTINEFSGKKTIVMIAHRLSTVKQCDIIYFLDDGRIIDKGTYSDLLEGNDAFRQMTGMLSSAE